MLEPDRELALSRGSRVRARASQRRERTNLSNLVVRVKMCPFVCDVCTPPMNKCPCGKGELKSAHVDAPRSPRREEGGGRAQMHHDLRRGRFLLPEERQHIQRHHAHNQRKRREQTPKQHAKGAESAEWRRQRRRAQLAAGRKWSRFPRSC